MYKVIEHQIVADNLTKKQAEKYVELQESIVDSNEAWFEIQKE